MGRRRAPPHECGGGPTGPPGGGVIAYHSGLSAARVQTVALREGDVYVLNGSKMWATAAIYAVYVLGLVRSGEKQSYKMNLARPPKRDL